MPVEPAISRCGMVSSAATRMRPLMSLPSGIVRCEWRAREFVATPASAAARSARAACSGTSMPTVGLPGMRSIRIDSACRPRQRSSVRFVMRLYLMPASGLNSKVVTTGPGLICTTLPSTLNSSNLALMRPAVSFSSCSSYGLRAGGSLSRSVEGRRKTARWDAVASSGGYRRAETAGQGRGRRAAPDLRSGQIGISSMVRTRRLRRRVSMVAYSRSPVPGRPASPTAARRAPRSGVGTSGAVAVRVRRRCLASSRCASVRFRRRCCGALLGFRDRAAGACSRATRATPRRGARYHAIGPAEPFGRASRA